MFWLWAMFLVSVAFGAFDRHIGPGVAAVLLFLWAAGVAGVCALGFFGDGEPSLAVTVGCVVYHLVLVIVAGLMAFHPRSRMG